MITKQWFEIEAGLDSFVYQGPPQLETIVLWSPSEFGKGLFKIVFLLKEYFGRYEIGKEYLNDGEQFEDDIEQPTSQEEKQIEIENEDWLNQV